MLFAVKTRKEAKRIALTESLSETKVKVDELQKIVRDQEARKDEYAAILAEQSKGNVVLVFDFVSNAYSYNHVIQLLST